MKSKRGDEERALLLVPNTIVVGESSVFIVRVLNGVIVFDADHHHDRAWCKAEPLCRGSAICLHVV